jgi:hypothetical protein
MQGKEVDLVTADSEVRNNELKVRRSDFQVTIKVGSRNVARIANRQTKCADHSFEVARPYFIVAVNVTIDQAIGTCGNQSAINEVNRLGVGEPVSALDYESISSSKVYVPLEVTSAIQSLCCALDEVATLSKLESYRKTCNACCPVLEVRGSCETGC